MANPHYRLRGDVGGIPRRFPIAPGEIRIGSIGDNNIVLPVRGVSRRHARLSCGPEGLSIEDLDSKNGVHVNGARIHHAVLAPGAELRLGPVTLTVE
ncbi:MAG TPA: FHA domain-containing protein, partial [Myxococcota bacterium]|nr:FHA domain-containing protein [Myxococcota bacterium]